MTRRSALPVVAALSLALGLSACSSSDDSAPTDDATTTEATTDVETEASEEAATTPLEETSIDIGESFTDPDIGDAIEVLSVVRGFSSAETVEGGEAVLVEVKITPGEEYGGRISASNFKFSWDGGANFRSHNTGRVSDEMDAAGYAVLEDISRIDGGEHTGWIAFLVDEQADTYVLQYLRPESNVIGSDDVLEEFLVEIEVPAP